jgi:hypothetical protein
MKYERTGTANRKNDIESEWRGPDVGSDIHAVLRGVVSRKPAITITDQSSARRK